MLARPTSLTGMASLRTMPRFYKKLDKIKTYLDTSGCLPAQRKRSDQQCWLVRWLHRLLQADVDDDWEREGSGDGEG